MEFYVGEYGHRVLEIAMPTSMGKLKIIAIYVIEDIVLISRRISLFCLDSSCPKVKHVALAYILSLKSHLYIVNCLSDIMK